MPHTKQIQQLLYYLLRLDRQFDFISRQLPRPLTLNESHILAEIKNRPNASASDMVSDLVLEKSTVSRTLHSLEVRGYLQRQVSDHDRRQKRLILSKHGDAILHRDYKVRDDQLSRCLAGLSDLERTDFTSCLKLLADGLGASQVLELPLINAAGTQIRRLAQVMGSLGRNYLGTGLAKEEFQILSLLHEARELNFSRLRELVPYEATFLSRLVTEYAKKNVIRKRDIASDRRHLQLQLAERGLKFCREKRQIAMTRLAEALPAIEKVLPRFLQIFAGFLGLDDTGKFLDVVDGIRIRLIKNPGDLNIARGFLVEQLVRNNKHHSLSDSLFSVRNFSAAAYEDSRLKGVIEIGKDGEEFRLINFAVSEGLASRRVPLELLAESFLLVFKKRKARRILIDEESTVVQWINDFLSRTKKEGSAFVVAERHLGQLQEALASIP